MNSSHSYHHRTPPNDHSAILRARLQKSNRLTRWLLGLFEWADW